MTAFCMPREPHKFRLDDRVIAALKQAAAEQGTSFNAYVEGLLFAHAKVIGKIPPDAEPLPETRGGKRKGAGKPKKTEGEAGAK
ncbi:hypothetical protein IQ266_18995 [filamentous cyanobacterium LEGE 11480]|uniref:Uncharacterized protein n=1 Tax=Romeriopsis navalis LEGE 11480 TaxID=2777977 RepID=A0A928VRV7_9CYAN|nr:hypothetical protein [Romeriopsis navalis]MBE9031826.1 hypothetical protein [Romeriopsis navalis LEGE 11480]